jgi:uncharacterized phage-associated protein
MGATKTIKAEDVAKYFIYLANKNKKVITNKKLQKLVYYSQAWSLVLNNKKMFKEPIEAWVHGPAVRSLYVQYKNFGFNPIEEEVSEKDIRLSKKDKELLDEVWNVYGKFDAGYLEMLSHSEQPWQDARDGLQGHENSNNEIPTKSMKSFYSSKLENSKK